MPYGFEINEIAAVLRACPEYEAGHHMQRPYMSAYQLAIAFAAAYPNRRATQELVIGGRGSGVYESLAQQLARFISSAIRSGEAGPIEGGFLSHENLNEMSFANPNSGEAIQVSTIHTKAAHSIFRVTDGSAS